MQLERYDGTRLVFALTSSAAFVVLAAVVPSDTVQQGDDALRQLFRPDDVWGVNQLIFGNMVDGLAPVVATSLLLLAGLVVAVRLRSPRPLGYVVTLAAAAVILTVVSKALLGRPDPHGNATRLGGAFPSGHMVILLVALGGAVLVLRACPRWWDWGVVAVVELTMGVSLLFLAMHWFTDVIGGALLAMPIVALAGSTRLHRWVHFTPERRSPSVDRPRSRTGSMTVERHESPAACPPLAVASRGSQT